MSTPRGFTLVEALVATGVLMVCLAWIVPLFTLSSNANRQGRLLTVGTLLAIEKLEELRNGPQAIGGSVEGNAAGFHDGFDASGRPLEPGDLVDASYRRRWSIGISADRPTMVVLRVRVGYEMGDVSLVGLRRLEDW